MQTEFDDVCYIITPLDSNPTAFSVKVIKTGDETVFCCTSENNTRGHTTLSLTAFAGLKFAGYKFIRSEQEFLAWRLKYGK
jgi:hypothetical protein